MRTKSSKEEISVENKNYDQLAERINREAREMSDNLRKRIADIEKEASAYYNDNFLGGGEKVEYKLVKVNRYKRIAEWIVAGVIGYAIHAGAVSSILSIRWW